MDDFEPKTFTDVKKKRGKPFKKGESGNKLGKRRGTRNKATLATEAMLDGARLPLTQKLIDKAHDGDMAAMRLLAPFILPPSPERKLNFKLPPLETAADALAVLARIAEGVAHGELGESEARMLVSLVHTFLEARGQLDFESRLTALEKNIPDIEAKVLQARPDPPRPEFRPFRYEK